MPQFLIEIRHENDHGACVRALDAIARYGSHFITHANWGCKQGAHSGWLITELPGRDDALRMVPPQFRNEARIVEVEHFTRERVAALMAELEG